MTTAVENDGAFSSPKKVKKQLKIQIPDVTSIDDNVTERLGSYTAPIISSDFADRNLLGFNNHNSSGSSRHYSFLKRTTPKIDRSVFNRFSNQHHFNCGDVSTKELAKISFTRALSRTCTIGSETSSSIPPEEWRPIFDKLDKESDGVPNGKIPLSKFKELLEEDPLWTESVPNEIQDRILVGVDRNNDGVIDFDEFIELVKGNEFGFSRKRRRAFRQLLKETVEFIVPYRYSYQNQYSCSPPPLFMIVISLVQIFVFCYNAYQIGFVGINGPVPSCSRLVYDPNKRYEVWRYLTYMLIHSGFFHLTFNVLVQLILGIPLEMVHGWWRVMLVYIFGVMAGSLWTSVIRPNVFLSGASGGVYALISAHLGTVIMNFREMAYPWWRVCVVVVIALTDTVIFVYDIYVVGHSKPISYPAHISGAVTGFLVGITVLKNLQWQKYERYIWFISALIFVLLMLVAIIWNLSYPSHFTGTPIGIPCLSDNVL